MKKIGIVGAGIVGGAVKRLFEKRYGVYVYDIAPKGFVSVTQGEINLCDLGIVCTPTPMAADGSCDTSIVEEVVGWLKTPLILIKSTIAPGTTERLKKETGKRIVFSPEYIGESTYAIPFWKGYPHPTDMSLHEFHIFGGGREDTSEVLEFFKEVMGPDCKLMQTDSTTAEIVKYFENVFGAVRVTLCNEFYEICKAFGVDYDEMRELFLLDGRFNRQHTAVFKNNRSFSGRCFPKDICAIIKAAEGVGYSPKLLREVVKSNARFSQKKEMQDLPKIIENR